jgi:hypothetical protein
VTDKTAPTTEEHREQLGALEHVDPHLLVLDENVGDVARLVPEFAASGALTRCATTHLASPRN